MLKMTDVAKVYRTEHVETHALSSFDLEVREGEFVSVMGPSISTRLITQMYFEGDPLIPLCPIVHT